MGAPLLVSLSAQKLLSTHKLNADDLTSLEPDDFASRYKVQSKLGAGAFADVLRVKELPAKSDRALKVLRASAQHPAGMQPEVALFREARALKHGKHTNVVQLLSVLRVPKMTPDGTLLGPKRSGGHHHGYCWALLLEYMQSGSLAQMIYQQMVSPQSRVYSDMSALTWAVDMASGLAHLHSLSPMIIHRDLKLENILLQKDSDGTRKLPVAKLSDFGLHVMLDKPPCPYLIKAEGGCPMLTFFPPQQQQQQQQDKQQQPQQETQEKKQQQQLEVKQQEEEDVLDCNTTPSLSAPIVRLQSFDSATPATTPNSSGGGACSGDAGSGVPCSGKQHCACHGPVWEFAAAAPAGEDAKWRQQSEAARAPAAARQAAAAALGLTNGDARCAKHVSFSESTDGGEQLRRAIANGYPHSAPLPSLTLPPQKQQQQQQRYRPLSINALKRLSIDSGASGSIPLVLQAPSSRSGSGGGYYCRASVPVSSLRLSSDALTTIVSGSGLRGGGDAAAADDLLSLKDILAAANSERDYLVSVPDVVARPDSLAVRPRRNSTNGSSIHSTSRPATPAAAASGAASAGGGSSGLRQAPGPSSMASSLSRAGSARSSDFATAASMLWEDMMEDGCCHELLDAELFDACMSTPLAYDLTHHTGSCMYMAPEVFRGEPYNETVDIFSLGVILYELFSRSLLLYTHTPANSEKDSMAYAARVAEGFRPSCPKALNPGIWQVIDRCWDADPSARPSAAWVLQQLQQLLDADEGAAAAKAAASAGAGGLLGSVFGRGKTARKAAANSSSDDETPAAPPAPAAAAPGATASAEIVTKVGSKAHQAEQPDLSGPASSQPACGCVIC